MPLLRAVAPFLTLLLAVGVGCVDARAVEPIGFNKHVRPIFVKHCLACHGGVKQAGGLSFITRGQALAETESGVASIEPGDADASYLIDRVRDEDDDFRMPPREHGPRLTDAEVDTLRRWIDAGAPWEAPWAFEPPTRRVAPASARGEAWSHSRIDRFVHARMEQEGLSPSREADRAQWLRRATFDLIGLPPTESERRLFETDLAPGAYERVVDRLLASPHFGERWASVWLDLARYADTMGYERDPPRDVWPWRDWVVEALNADTPYDEFLLKQFAGDLLPAPTIGDRLATAFHRNSQTNTEGGTDDEEYRWAAVVDRVDSTWQALLGTTMGCARCHDHPYDPLLQKDYYRFAAFLNNTQDCDLVEDWPKVRAPLDRGSWEEAQRLDDELAEVRARVHKIGVEVAGAASAWRPLPVETAHSTGETRLVVRGEQSTARDEVVAQGTVTDRSFFTIQVSPGEGPLTALRIDASPVDPDKALVTPEYGFVLSRLRVFVERGDAPSEEAEELFFTEVLADEADGFHRSTDSIRDNSGGWGPYTRMHHARWAAFLLDEAVELADGDRLRVELKHDMITDGQGPLVMRRLRLSGSSDARFSTLTRDPELRGLREREEEILKARKAIPSTSAPVLAERPVSLRRHSHLFKRGNWLAPSDRVDPGTPGELPGAALDRLELAEWLGSEDNPLTARVMVNRVWSEFFGKGIVATLDDFGSTGAEPSHPELLDDLAARFQGEMQWRLKTLAREIVLSAVYRQDSRVPAGLVERDPSNRLLARGPRTRLDAEMVRDQALVLSGRFNPKLGGPPVMPYQPDGVWQSVYNNNRWETAEGPERFRRALYTYWKRTAAYPSMVAFDAPSREQCTASRPTTNTPLQALVTLNDPAYVELAEGLADRMLARRDESPRGQIAWAAQEATGRPLPADAVDELVALYKETNSEDDQQRFALTLVAGVILNLDATLTK